MKLNVSALPVNLLTLSLLSALFEVNSFDGIIMTREQNALISNGQEWTHYRDYPIKIVEKKEMSDAVIDGAKNDVVITLKIYDSVIEGIEKTLHVEPNISVDKILRILKLSRKMILKMFGMFDELLEEDETK